MPRIARLSPAAVGNGLSTAGRQLKVWWSAERDESVDSPGLYSRLSLFSFIIFCLNILGLLYFVVTGYAKLYPISENTPIELLTAALFGGSGLALFLAAAAAGRGWLRRLYILAGLAALFLAGEELSWGQHIFGFVIPDAWQGIYIQEEAGLHNNYVLNGIFSFLYTAIPTLCYAVPVAAFCARKYRLGALPLPSLWLAFFFALSVNFGRALPLPQIIALQGRHLLLILGIFLGVALLSRDKRLLLVVLAVITLSGAVFYLNDQFAEYIRVQHEEIVEYLLSLAVFLYSLQLLRDHGGARWLNYGRRLKASWFRPRELAAGFSHPTDTANFQRPGRSWQYPAWRWAWPAACLAVILSSIGLVLFDRQLTAAWGREYQSLLTRPPAIQSHSWHIYHTPGRLTYVKNAACPRITAERNRFFLHIIPIREADLPPAAQAHGFQNRNFNYNGEVKRFLSADESCMAVIALPDYPIAQIVTGQLVPPASPVSNDRDNAAASKSWRVLWKAELDLDSDYYRAAYQPIAAGQAGPPLARSAFDLYRYNNALYYLKESCAPADTADRFFLHIVPLRVGDLPAERRPYRFSNLDFDFNRRGHWFDGKCLAIAKLPEYPIAEIRTGQFTASGPVWEVVLPGGH